MAFFNQITPHNPTYYNTLVPYHIIYYDGIHYGTCVDYTHISRHRGLRQVTHNPNLSTRYIALETPNAFTTYLAVDYYEVPQSEANRLDLIAYKYLGNATYSLVIAYMNKIEDGFSVQAGQRLMIPKSFNAISSV